MERVMFIGAHQDDLEGSAGGLFARLHRSYPLQGLAVTLTNGVVGHYSSEYLLHPERLRDRRVLEASRAAEVLGLDYQLLTDWQGREFPDADLQVTRESKGAVWWAIRQFEPELLITLPVNDVTDPYGMHNDHSTVGEIVKRIAYLIPVPYAFPEYYGQEDRKRFAREEAGLYVSPPAIVTVYDVYSQQIEPDLVVDIGEVMDLKTEAWSKHVSQWKEWLPWVGRYPSPDSLQALRKQLEGRSKRLAAKMGLSPGLYEAFTITGWGRIPTIEQIRFCFPADVFQYERAASKLTALAG